MKKSIILLAVIAALSSCKHVPEQWIEFDSDWSSLDPETCFIPTKSSYGTISESSINNCLVPGAVTVKEAEEETKTTSFNATALARELVSNLISSTTKSYIGTYKSIDQDGNPIRLSGRIIVPANGQVSRIMVVGHFTIGNNLEAPSEAFPIEGVFAGKGLAVIISDYIGYGVTADLVHPYLCAELTARNVVDMYEAALPFLEFINCKPKYDDIFIYGYSQGGATAVAVQKYMEEDRPHIDIRICLAGGGPYDICATYDKIVENDYTDYPCAIPMIIQGMNIGNHIDLDLTKIFQPVMCENIDKWINSKNYYMHEITQMMGSKKVSTILTEEARNKLSPEMGKLYLAMIDNSTVQSFEPISPLYLFHSMDDMVVPFENAVAMRTHLSNTNANVSYNFGKYGSHTAGFLRFLLTVMEYLGKEGDI